MKRMRLASEILWLLYLYVIFFSWVFSCHLYDITLRLSSEAEKWGCTFLDFRPPNQKLNKLFFLNKYLYTCIFIAIENRLRHHDSLKNSKRQIQATKLKYICKPIYSLFFVII
jgi:hypothetical protein